jgi:hypothetical protein
MKPVFQMPFMCSQTWRASTYQNHSPDSDSIDLMRFSGASNISLGEAVFASADGTVKEAYDTNDIPDVAPYGSVVTIDHGDSWKTQYVHLNDALSVKKNDKVVRGQRIGSIAKVAGLDPHLHYVQMKNDKAVRVTFNGVAIGVHAGAKKADGTFPTQNLTSANCPTGITKKVLDNGTSATCKKGAGLRATVKCLIPKLDKVVAKHGSWVGAKGTSTVHCAGSQQATGHGFETS